MQTTNIHRLSLPVKVDKKDYAESVVVDFLHAAKRGARPQIQRDALLPRVPYVLKVSPPPSDGDVMRRKVVHGVVVAFALVGFAGCSSSDNAPSVISEAMSEESSAVSITDTVAGNSTSTTSADGTVRISVTVGVDSGENRIEEIPLGSQVELSFTNPSAADDYHVHGYDLGGGETPKGDTKTFTFTADKAGDFEVESHATEEVLVVLRVS